MNKKKSFNIVENSKIKVIDAEEEIKTLKVKSKLFVILTGLLMFFFIVNVLIIIIQKSEMNKIKYKYNQTKKQIQNQEKVKNSQIKEWNFPVGKLKYLMSFVSTLRKTAYNPKSKLIKFLQILYYLSPRKIVGKEKIRIGGKRDGGYIMINDFSGSKIAYSFGIGKNVDWDYEMVKKGYDIYMYDHTINKLPFKNHKFHWKKIGICISSKKNSKMKTLEELLLENEHNNKENMILKIDTEGLEEDIINETKEETLKKFSQIILEFHHFDMIKENLWYSKIKRALKKLNKTHQIIHLHLNNGGSVYLNELNFPLTSIIEVSYIKKEGNKFINDFSVYPIKGLDFRNIPRRPDILLGFPGIFGFEKE